MFNYPENIKINRNIRLKRISKKDYKEVFDILNDPVVTEYLPINPFEDEEEAKSFLDHIISKAEKSYGAVWKIENIRSIATIGLVDLLDWSENENSVYMSYLLKKSYWNIGITSTVVKELLNKLNNIGIKKIIAPVYADNKRSIRVLEKNGFKMNEEKEVDGKFVLYYEYKY